MLGFLCFGAAAANADRLFFAPVALPPLRTGFGQLAPPVPAAPRAPAAVADFNRAEMMQQFDSSFETPQDEAQAPGAFQHFFAVVAAGFAFFVAYVTVTMRARTGQIQNIPTKSVRSAAPRMSEQWGDNDYADLWNAMRQESENTRNRVMSGPPEAVLSRAETVYVVIFNEGTENEGVYTLQAQDGPSRTHLLTFEDTEDAERFAAMLQGQGLPASGNACMWDAGKTMEYCMSCEYAVTLVPYGTLFSPPQNNSIDEEAFRHQERMRNWTPPDVNRDPMDENQCGQDECNLDMHMDERIKFERLMNGDFSP